MQVNAINPSSTEKVCGPFSTVFLHWEFDLGPYQITWVAEEDTYIVCGYVANVGSTPIGNGHTGGYTHCKWLFTITG